MKTKIKYPWFRTFVRQYLVKVIIALVVIELLVITFLQNRNDKPIAQDDKALVYLEHTVDIPVLQNDSDGDIEDELTIASIATPKHGQVEILGRAIHYIPAEDYVGIDRFSYELTDGKDSVLGWVEVDIQTNMAPTAEADQTMIYPWTSSVEIGVLNNDSDREGDPVSLDHFTQPAHGELVQEGDMLIYQLVETSAEKDTFTYTVTDGKRVSEPVSVEIEIRHLQKTQFGASAEFGDLRNFTPVSLNRWELKEVDGNLVYGLNTTDYNSPAGIGWVNTAL